jgi:hypothetical protein
MVVVVGVEVLDNRVRVRESLAFALALALLVLPLPGGERSGQCAPADVVVAPPAGERRGQCEAVRFLRRREPRGVERVRILEELGAS